MSFIYDAGVLIAADRNSRTVWADHRAQLELGFLPATTAPVVAQVSRSPRQASLHRFVRGCSVVPLASDEAVAIGALLARAGTSDVVDAHVAITASRIDAVIVTSDLADMRALATQLDRDVAVVSLL